MVGLYTFKISMCKLEELSKFLEYLSNMLEISSQLIWKIPVTYWKFPVGSKLNLAFFDTLLPSKILKIISYACSMSFFRILRASNMSKKNSCLSLLEISSKLLEYSRLTDWIFPAYYLDTPKTYLIPPV